MKTLRKTTFWLGMLTTGWLLVTTSPSKGENSFPFESFPILAKDQLKEAAFKILDTRCNVCHRRKNPFMIFNERNMTKRASKIYKMVYLELKMPKGNENKLSHEEMATLQKWLFTQKIF